jgi:hypothetical protein
MGMQDRVRRLKRMRARVAGRSKWSALMVAAVLVAVALTAGVLAPAALAAALAVALVLLSSSVLRR